MGKCPIKAVFFLDQIKVICGSMNADSPFAGVLHFHRAGQCVLCHNE